MHSAISGIQNGKFNGKEITKLIIPNTLTIAESPVKVFFVRILDVSLGTTRTIITVRGQKYLAALIGFIEVFIWFVIVREALNTNETSLFVALSYAGGYATGTIIGGILSTKLVKTNLTVQVVTSCLSLPDELRVKDYAVTVLDVTSMDTETKRIMLLMEINSKK